MTTNGDSHQSTPEYEPVGPAFPDGPTVPVPTGCEVEGPDMASSRMTAAGPTAAEPAVAGPTAAEPTGTGTAVPAPAGLTPQPGRPHGTGGRVRRAWRSWRHSRPFWGGLFVILGAVEILITVRAPLPVILRVGPQGLAGYLVPLIMLICGVLLLFNPQQRLFYSLVALVAALGTWLTSNLGGFVIGLLLGLVGGSLAFAWTPIDDRTPHPRRRRRNGAAPRSAQGTSDDTLTEELLR
jgi:hypothetical protein